MSKKRATVRLYFDHAKEFARINNETNGANSFDCAHFMIYEVVLSFSERRCGFYGKLSTLGKWCHLQDERTVKTKLSKLQNAGFISIEKRKGTTYSILATCKLQKSGKFVLLWADSGEQLKKRGITAPAALLAYSVISHFEQSAKGWRGSTKYLMEWMPKISKSHISIILHALYQAQLIKATTNAERALFYATLTRDTPTTSHQKIEEDDDIPF